MLNVYQREISTNLLFFQSTAIIASRKSNLSLQVFSLIDISKIFSSCLLKLSYSQGDYIEKVTYPI